MTRVMVPSPRETEVLALIAEGMGNDEIAAILGIEAPTVKTHIRHVAEKLDVVGRSSTRSAIVAQAIRKRWIK